MRVDPVLPSRADGVNPLRASEQSAAAECERAQSMTQQDNISLETKQMNIAMLNIALTGTIQK